jgi:hypothetical protein
MQIVDNEGKVQAEASGPAWQPLQWKAPPNSPIIAIREGTDNGAYKIWAVTSVPVAVLEMGYGKPLNPNAYKIY